MPELIFGTIGYVLFPYLEENKDNIWSRDLRVRKAKKYVHQNVKKTTTINDKNTQTDYTKESAKSVHRPDCRGKNPEMKNTKKSKSKNKREIKQREGWANNNLLLMKGGGGN